MNLGLEKPVLIYTISVKMECSKDGRVFVKHGHVLFKHSRVSSKFLAILIDFNNFNTTLYAEKGHCP